ncbi:ROK family protein [Microbacterium resistens]|uniref:ROK family protein n=1 Tax=Microbacterium resistens TaxID=156977 RepID=UPI00082A3D28|nr:ROK family protein [Microbacterium resistens]
MELCIDFGGTGIKIAVAADDRILSSARLDARRDAGDLDAAAASARALLAEAGDAPDAVGIAVPGVVDPDSGRMLHANAKYDAFRDLDLRAWSAAEFGAPAVVENDARAALVGETTSGVAAGERDAVLVTLGTGIGTAAQIAGVPLRGRRGHAGILGGHVTIDRNGPVCPCGNVGCGEALASSASLAQQSPTGAALTLRDLFADDAHAGIRDAFLHVWGATVVTLIHMYDPAVVVLSGGVLRAGDAVRAPLESYARAHLWPSVTAPRFLVPPEPELSVARGLSVLARTALSRPQEDQ